MAAAATPGVDSGPAPAKGEYTWGWSGAPLRREDGGRVYYAGCHQVLPDKTIGTSYRTGDIIYCLVEGDDTPWVGQCIEFCEDASVVASVKNGADGYDSKDVPSWMSMRVSLRWMYRLKDVIDDCARSVAGHPCEVFFSDHVTGPSVNSVNIIEGRATLTTDETKVPADLPEDPKLTQNIYFCHRYYRHQGARKFTKKLAQMHGLSSVDSRKIRELDEGELDTLLSKPSSSVFAFYRVYNVIRRAAPTPSTAETRTRAQPQSPPRRTRDRSDDESDDIPDVTRKRKRRRSLYVEISDDESVDTPASPRSNGRGLRTRRASAIAATRSGALAVDLDPDDEGDDDGNGSQDGDRGDKDLITIDEDEEVAFGGHDLDNDDMEIVKDAKYRARLALRNSRRRQPNVRRTASRTRRPAPPPKRRANGSRAASRDAQPPRDQPPLGIPLNQFGNQNNAQRRKANPTRLGPRVPAPSSANGRVIASGIVGTFPSAVSGLMPGGPRVPVQQPMAPRGSALSASVFASDHVVANGYLPARGGRSTQMAMPRAGMAPPLAPTGSVRPVTAAMPPTAVVPPRPVHLVGPMPPQGQNVISRALPPQGQNLLPGVFPPQGHNVLSGVLLPQGQNILSGAVLPQVQNVLPGALAGRVSASLVAPGGAVSQVMVNSPLGDAVAVAIPSRSPGTVQLSGTIARGGGLGPRVPMVGTVALRGTAAVPSSVPTRTVSPALSLPQQPPSVPSAVPVAPRPVSVPVPSFQSASGTVNAQNAAGGSVVGGSLLANALVQSPPKVNTSAPCAAGVIAAAPSAISRGAAQISSEKIEQPGISASTSPVRDVSASIAGSAKDVVARTGLTPKAPAGKPADPVAVPPAKVAGHAPEDAVMSDAKDGGVHAKSEVLEGGIATDTDEDLPSEPRRGVTLKTEAIDVPVAAGQIAPGASPEVSVKPSTKTVPGSVAEVAAKPVVKSIPDVVAMSASAIGVGVGASSDSGTKAVSDVGKITENSVAKDLSDPGKVPQREPATEPAPKSVTKHISEDVVKAVSQPAPESIPEPMSGVVSAQTGADANPEGPERKAMNGVPGSAAKAVIVKKEPGSPAGVTGKIAAVKAVDPPGPPSEANKVSEPNGLGTAVKETVEAPPAPPADSMLVVPVRRETAEDKADSAAVQTRSSAKKDRLVESERCADRVNEAFQSLSTAERVSVRSNVSSVVDSLFDSVTEMAKDNSGKVSEDALASMVEKIVVGIKDEVASSEK